MSRPHGRNKNWVTWAEDGTSPTIEHAQLAVLMDIREELQKLNAVIGCSNFLGLPHTLKSIERKLDRRTAEGKKAATGV